MISEDQLRYYFSRPIKSLSTEVQQIIMEIRNNSKPIKIIVGIKNDVAELHELNKKWMKETRKENLSKGFLTTLYTEEQFKKIIALNELVVAEI